MAENILDFDEGYDAFELGEEFDTDKPQAWQDGWLEAAARDGYGE
jgi:hypothetical protein